jgi:hypothetical protein
MSRDLRSADDLSLPVVDWRDGSGRFDGRAAFVQSNGLQVFHGLAGGDTDKHRVFCAVTFSRGQALNRLTKHLWGGVSKQPFGRRVPAGDCAIQGHADDCDQ